MGVFPLTPLMLKSQNYKHPTLYSLPLYRQVLQNNVKRQEVNIRREKENKQRVNENINSSNIFAAW